MPSVRLGRDSVTEQEVRIGDIERRSGLYVLGKPGMGKSALLVNIMLGDSDNGHGLFFLDPHGDAITDLARRIPDK
jgi:DNA replication protein DnaC